MDTSDYKAEFNFAELQVTPEAVCRLMGYVNNDVPEPVMEVVLEAFSKISAANDIRVEYKIFDNIWFNVTDKSISISDSLFFLKNIIFNQVKNSTGVALFLCTAGRSTDAFIRQARDTNDLLSEYIFDVIGSEVAEAAAAKMEEHLRIVKMAEGLNVSMRFSPGYCGWDLQEQKKLFSFFPDNFCGITLSDSAFMSPVKSVSGIIGIGAYRYKTVYQCRICSDKYCIYRNKNKPV